MIIRRQQLEALAAARKSQLAREIVSFLKEQYNEARSAPEAELLPPVQRLVRRAEYYGLNTEQDIAIYSIAGFMLGESFDIDFPAVQQVLPSPVLSSGEKADWLLQWTTELFQTLEK